MFSAKIGHSMGGLGGLVAQRALGDDEELTAYVSQGLTRAGLLVCHRIRYPAEGTA